VIQHDSSEECERFREQQRDRSGRETARDYSASAYVIHFQIFIQCITEEGEPPQGGVWKDRSDESFVQLGKGHFRGTPQGRGYGVEHSDHVKNFCGRSEHERLLYCRVEITVKIYWIKKSLDMCFGDRSNYRICSRHNI